MRISISKNTQIIVMTLAFLLLATGGVLALRQHNETVAEEEAANMAATQGTTIDDSVVSGYPSDAPDSKVPGGTANSDSNVPGGSTSSGPQALKAPSGALVSNHAPNLSGSPAPNTLHSVCTTTPGAQCQIDFASGGVTKSLPAKTADEDGVVQWDWKLQDIGLTAGTWTITAKATLNAATKSTPDSLNLQVAP